MPLARNAFEIERTAFRKFEPSAGDKIRYNARHKNLVRAALRQRTARPGPSKVARMPSPVLFTKFPRYFSTVCFARRS
jgi:hypothetical protein